MFAPGARCEVDVAFPVSGIRLQRSTPISKTPPYVSALVFLFSLLPSLRCWFRRYGVLPLWCFAPNTPFFRRRLTHALTPLSLSPQLDNNTSWRTKSLRQAPLLTICPCCASRDSGNYHHDPQRRENGWGTSVVEGGGRSTSTGPCGSKSYCCCCARSASGVRVSGQGSAEFQRRCCACCRR